MELKHHVTVKLCGITRLEDALRAIELGVRYTGFIFAPQSPRAITPDQAGEIITALPHDIIPVGVFVNAPRDRVLDVISVSGIKLAQFHGYESPEYCTSFGTFPVMKAFRVRPNFGLLDIEPFLCNCYLLDAFDNKRAGGTGKTFDWNLARPIAEKYRVMLAGGLTPENVVEAVQTVRPYGVDINSGVEEQPGVKDHAKLEQLLRNLEAAGHHAVPTPERSI